MRMSASPPVRDHAGPPLGADTRAVLTRAGVPADVVDAVAGPVAHPEPAPVAPGEGA
jgi:formyl-CoA transferase